MKNESVLEQLHYYDSAPELFAEHLASQECKQLAETMESMTALEMNNDAETDMVNCLIPEARLRNHTSTDAERRCRDVKAAFL